MRPPFPLFLFVFILGVATVLGFAPFYWFVIPLVTLALLFHLWTHAHTARRAAWLGFAFGLGHFLAGVSWVYVSMHDFGYMPAWLAALATLLFCAVLALFPALAGHAAHRLGGTRHALAVIPATWVLSEWLRGWIFTGFPWLALGYSQAPASPLAGFAPLAGVYGVSLAGAASAALLAMLIEHARKMPHAARSSAALPLALLAALWLGGYALKRIEWTSPAGEPVAVSLLQGNIPQDVKWREDKLRITLDTYSRLTLASTGRLIVLPETALPLFHRDVPQAYLDLLAGQARKNSGDILIGLAEDGDNETYYNSVLSFGTSPPQAYRKTHLVPFGEFVPVKPLFGWIIRVLKIPLMDFSRGAAAQQPLQVAGQHVAVNICYEDAFGEEIIRQLPQATLLVNVSNVAWFGDSVAPRQHLQIAQMRALETGRTMLRATNTGMTAIIDRHGKVVKSAPAFTAMALEGEAQGMQGATPFVRWGNLPALLAAGLSIAAAWAGGRLRRT